MQGKQFRSYQPLNLDNIALNQFSELYSLNPIGIGQPLVESLTSYISRLAFAHCVYPGILMKKILQSLIEKKYSSNNLYQIYSYTGVINGTGEMALDIANTLAKLTFNQQLKLLSLTSFSEIFPTRGLLSKLRFPQCIGSISFPSRKSYGSNYTFI